MQSNVEKTITKLRHQIDTLSGEVSFPDVDCESLKNLIKECTQTLEFVRQSYRHYCGPILADKADVAIPPCAQCNDAIVGPGEINATALRFAIDFCSRSYGADEALAIAKRFKFFLEQ